jgi:hypothetical protein
MTQTTTILPKPEAIATTPPPNPSDILLALIVALLAPMFLCVTAGDIAVARRAAHETVNAYRAKDHADLIAVAQIIGYGLAALGSLSLSMEDDLSLSMTLRLRANANALNRSAEQNRRAIRQNQNTPSAPEIHDAPEIHHPQDEPRTDPDLMDAAAAQMLAQESLARLQPPEPPAPPVPPATPAALERRHQEMWAIAMVKESAEITETIPHLPPDERQTATVRAAALSGSAHDLLTGDPSKIAAARAAFPPNPQKPEH